MVDRNKNGIPDNQERGGRLPSTGGLKPQVAGPQDAGQGPSPWLSPYGAAGEVGKGIQGLIGGMVGPKAPQRMPQAAQGTKTGLNRFASDFPGAGKLAAPEPAEKSFADYLNEAMSLIGGGGSSGGGVPNVNYDPQRNTLRQNAGENDARLEAMYRQLRGSIDADAPAIQGAYQGAIDQTSKISADAQAQTQGANDSALAQQNSVMQALGIQEAQGNQIQQGTDLSTQTARTIGDQATMGQAAGNRLVSNQSTALAHNTNIGNAAGLEGNLQRATNQSRLQSLLAEIDMQEQQQNQSVAAQNAGQSDNGLSQGMSLAQQLYGMDQDKQSREDSLQMSAQEAAASQEQGLPDLGAFLQALGIAPADIAADPAKYGTLLGNLPKYSVTR